ncbi:MAG TPA: DUF1800 domain-containing protein [Saprospiraceae bacterium]|nr:DUF1800 domain-containing protein [Saprospiraceae bacterium]HMP23997.1 DUF1800 domain-containing protein [Saprospiraceae bacterium]
MDRRTMLTALTGRRAATPAPAAPPDNDTTLAPYAGPWGFEQAAHLLRRTMFAPRLAQIKTAVAQGLDATLAQLFQELPMPDPPVNYLSNNDPFVPLGDTWVDAPYSRTINLRNPRHRSLRAWTMGLLLAEGVSIRERMTLFWHNHFATNNVNDPKYLYRHISLLRANAWGNFRELVKAITIDPTMLRFLNGNENTRVAPNENYARELLELFTIGKGEQVGPGDYSTFTEQDVAEMARVLTGWRDRGFNAYEEVPIEAFFVPNRHDTGAKQLSHRFDNEVISNMGNQEYAHLVDVIFRQPEVARHICRKLYRWFVYYKIDETVEANVIEPMAQLLIASNFEMRPVLEALLRSEHFFDVLSMGPVIKNPLDFVVSAVKTFDFDFPDNYRLQYEAWWRIFLQTPAMQMEYFNPPEVAGWKAYYQEPVFYRTWINAATLPKRMSFTDTLIINGLQAGNERLRLDALKFIKTIDDPYDPNAVVESFARILLPRPLTDNQLAQLKEVLIPGLPDYEWGVEYTDYEANPGNMQLAVAVDAKLRNVIRVLLSIPEFYLS